MALFPLACDCCIHREHALHDEQKGFQDTDEVEPPDAEVVEELAADDEDEGGAEAQRAA